MMGHKIFTGISGAIAFGLGTGLLLPGSLRANPLETMEGWVYTVKSSPDMGVQNYGLPEGLQDLGGAVVGDVTMPEPYILSVFQEDDSLIVSFEKLLFQRQVQDTNEQYREILDTAAAAPVGDWLISCQINGVDNPEIVAIAAPGTGGFDVEWYTTFSGVWRANRTTEQLEPLASENVRCYNMGYQYDG